MKPENQSPTNPASSPVGQRGSLSVIAGSALKELSPLEQFYVWVMRRNAKEQVPRTTKEWSLGRLQVVFDCRSAKGLWGRFGGGWNWKLGFQAGGNTMIVSLLVADLRFSLKQNIKGSRAEERE